MIQLSYESKTNLCWKTKRKIPQRWYFRISKKTFPFCQFEMIELTDERTPDKASFADNQLIMSKEAQRIHKKIGERDFVIALAIEGKQFPSETFSELISGVTVKGYSTITFIIGGSLGLDSIIKKELIC